MALYHVVLLIVTASICVINPKPTSSIGFSMPMIHRNSPHSPFHNPNITILDLIKEDQTRIKCLSSQTLRSNSGGTIKSPLCFGPGMYLTYFYIGSSFTKTFVYVDTGSDLIWTECYPCSLCAETSCPPFDPTTSLTYKRFPCDSFYCVHNNNLRCTSGNKCVFLVSYKDQTLAFGGIATETFHFPDSEGRYQNVSNIIFGCADLHVEGVPTAANGVLGLNLGPLSLLYQLSIDRFSYCLPPPSFVGYHPILFGSSAKLLGERVRFRTEEYLNMPFIILCSGIIVGSAELPVYFPLGTFDVKLDSGSTLTHLRADAFKYFLRDLEKVIPWKEKAMDSDVPNCYLGNIEDVQGINVTFRFHEEVDVTVSKGLFYTYNNYTCLGIAPVVDYYSTLGANAMIDYNVGYDLKKKEIWFQPMDCSIS